MRGSAEPDTDQRAVQREEERSGESSENLKNNSENPEGQLEQNHKIGQETTLKTISKDYPKELDDRSEEVSPNFK